MNKNNLPLVVSIIVHYQTPQNCIELVDELQYIDYLNHKIVVVDNKSNDGSYQVLELLLSKYSNVLLVQNKTNSGYGGGINFGVKRIQYLNPDFFHIINCDTRILNRKYITNVIDQLKKNPSIGLIGPGILTKGNEVQNTVMFYVSIKNALTFQSGSKFKSIVESVPKLYVVEVINGVCFIIKSAAFYQINGFDEDYFMYGEEHDLCFRLKKRGYTSFFWSGMSIYHENGNKIRKKVFTWREALIRCNQVLFLIKHKSKMEAYLLALLFTYSLFIKKISGVKFPDISFRMIIKGFFLSNNH